MKIVESGCVNCGLPCIGHSCKHFTVTRYICDECGAEEILYEFEGQELCIDCIKDQLQVVDGSDIYDY